MGKLVSIQIVRGLAAIAVAANHVWLSPEGKPGLRDALHIPFLAYLGVLIFFCISGMLMVLTTPLAKPGLKPAARFLRLRIERIYPVYVFWLTVLLCMAGAAALSGYNLLSDVRREASAGQVIRNYLLLPGLPDEAPYRMFIGQAWTLVYEMYFYVVFAVVLLFFNGTRLLLALCVLIGTPVMVAAATGFQAHRLGWANIDYLVTDPLVLNFLMGALFGAWLQQRKRRGLPLPLQGKAPLQWAAIAISVAICCLPTPFHLSFVRNVGTLLLLMSATFLTVGDNSPTRVLRYLGDASYSIYVAHVVFSSVALSVISKLPLPRDIAGVLLVASSIGLGCLSYEIIERPMSAYFHRKRALR